MAVPIHVLVVVVFSLCRSEVIHARLAMILFQRFHTIDAEQSLCGSVIKPLWRYIFASKSHTVRPSGTFLFLPYLSSHPPCSLTDSKYRRKLAVAAMTRSIILENLPRACPKTIYHALIRHSTAD